MTCIRQHLMLADTLPIMLVRSRWWRAKLPTIATLVILSAVALGLVVVPRIGASELVVLCSNNVSACEAVSAAYEEQSGQQVTVVRMPTSQALTRVRVPKESGEFDVWTGGPADAYAIAAREGHLASVELEAQSVPDRLQDSEGRWYGIYGGILSFCVTNSIEPPTTWAELNSDSSYRIVLPNPVSSGTAATILSVQVERLGGESAMVDYMKRLDEAVLSYTDSGTVPAHLVASGRADIGVSFAPYCETEKLLGADVSAIYPSDGTGFEVGAIAVLEESRRQDAAVQFLNYVVSDEGQQIGAQVENQLPVSESLEPNLIGQLEELETAIYGWNIQEIGASRAGLINLWLNEVRNGAY